MKVTNCSDKTFTGDFKSTLNKMYLLMQKAQELDKKSKEASNKLETMELSCKGSVK